MLKRNSMICHFQNVFSPVDSLMVTHELPVKKNGDCKKIRSGKYVIDVNVMVHDWTVKCSPGDQTSREVKPTPLSFSRKPLTRPFLFLFLRISLQKFHFYFRTPFKNFISHRVFPLKKVFLCSLLPINFHRWHATDHKKTKIWNWWPTEFFSIASKSRTVSMK